MSHIGSDLPLFHFVFSPTPPSCVPNITKNLVSVHQFCEDNQVYFIFHSHGFSVKDCTTETILLTRHTHNGLYPFLLASLLPRLTPPLLPPLLLLLTGMHVTTIPLFDSSVKFCPPLLSLVSLFHLPCFAQLSAKPRVIVFLILLLQIGRQLLFSYCFFRYRVHPLFFLFLVFGTTFPL